MDTIKIGANDVADGRHERPRGEDLSVKWYLHACPVCGGDLHDDLEDKGWVTCFMCARSFAAKDILAGGGEQRADRAEPVEALDLREAA